VDKKEPGCRFGKNEISQYFRLPLTGPDEEGREDDNDENIRKILDSDAVLAKVYERYTIHICSYTH
jgi:hypothetical protein